MEAEELRRELTKPSAYAHGPDHVEWLETHISQLFFAGERVYKIKKAVDFGFLDFTSLERRKFFCDEELRLNRRLSPEVYLGVVPIVRSDQGGLRVGAQGDPIEWAVEMTRLPAAEMLDCLLGQGHVDNDMMRALARLLADFHARAETGASVDGFGSPAKVAGLVHENLDQLSRVASEVASSTGDAYSILSSQRSEFLSARADAFLARSKTLMERRVAEGRIRDGHGDLHAGNICYRPSGIAIYDCIEFSAKFRCADVACDLAFLAMDLDYRGFSAFSAYFVREYQLASGDRELSQLIGFYKQYRALVRAKIALLSAHGSEDNRDLRRSKIAEAECYLDLAAQYDLPPALILMCGLPGSGKSTVARALAQPLFAIVHRSDVLRKSEPFARSGTEQSGAYGEGLYSKDRIAKTYASLLKVAIQDVEQGRRVIVDATFSKRSAREAFIKAAEQSGVPVYIVEVSASEASTRERLERRASDSREASAADFAVYLGAREEFEPPEEASQARLLQIDTDRLTPTQAAGALIELMIEAQLSKST